MPNSRAFISSHLAPSRSGSRLLESIQICEGVEFDKIAREWRCKWSPDNDKASLVQAQKALESVLGDVKKVDGVLGVERVVCGGCLDFKVVTTLPADKFGAWEEKGFEPEAGFVAKLEGIEGISQVETQTYTVRAQRLKGMMRSSFMLPYRFYVCFRKCRCKHTLSRRALRQENTNS